MSNWIWRKSQVQQDWCSTSTLKLFFVCSVGKCLCLTRANKFSRKQSAWSYISPWKIARFIILNRMKMNIKLDLDKNELKSLKQLHLIYCAVNTWILVLPTKSFFIFPTGNIKHNKNIAANKIRQIAVDCKNNRKRWANVYNMRQLSCLRLSINDTINLFLIYSRRAPTIFPSHQLSDRISQSLSTLAITRKWPRTLSTFVSALRDE